MPAKIKYPVINGLKECGGCGRWLPISEYKKARKHYTSRCRDCLILYYAEYRNRDENKVASKEYHKKYMADDSNRMRKNIYLRQWRKLPHVKETKNKWRKAWTLIQKQKAVEYKGGECVVCGYSTCLAAMDFHHNNPTEKDGYGTGALKAHWTFEKNKAELDKCVLVCVRCHREIHAGMVIL